MRVRRILAPLLFLLAAAEVAEYYAVSTTSLSFLEVVGRAGSAEAPRLIIRAYFSKPSPLPVRLLSLEAELLCNGTVSRSAVKDLTITARDFALLTSVDVGGEVRERCVVEVGASLTTNLLWIANLSLVTRRLRVEVDARALERPLLWAGWNTTAIVPGGCAEVIVLTHPGAEYLLRIYEEYYGQPPKPLLEKQGEGNSTVLFCAPRGVSPLVVKGYYVRLEDLRTGEAWEQIDSYPPRLKLRG